MPNETWMAERQRVLGLLNDLAEQQKVNVQEIRKLSLDQAVFKARMTMLGVVSGIAASAVFQLVLAYLRSK